VHGLGRGADPWSPLARGFLASDARAGEAAQSARAEADDTTRKFYGAIPTCRCASACGLWPPKRRLSRQLAYAWLLHKGVTAPIAGASKGYQIEQAVAALDVQLSAAEAALLEQPYEPRAVLGHS
jgi:aryl-alcohol dehydrogenase-like predicted oxidoreductase